METLIEYQDPQQQVAERTCKESPTCQGGKVYLTKMACGCCFCEKGSCFCDWHVEAGGCWS